MSVIFKATAVAAIATLSIVLLTITGALFGAFSGWIASLMMPVWIPAGLGMLGVKVTADQLYLLGAGLGWFGGFFRSTLQTTGRS